MSADPQLQLEDQLCFALYSASNNVVRAFRPRLRRLGITYPQYLVLLVLWQDGPSTVTALAARLDLESHAVTPLVTRLCDAGLTERVRGTSTDRRVVQVKLTDAGAELQQRARPISGEVGDVTGLTDAEIAALRDTLQALAHNIGEDDTDSDTDTDGTTGRASRCG